MNLPSVDTRYHRAGLCAHFDVKTSLLRVIALVVRVDVVFGEARTPLTPSAGECASPAKVSVGAVMWWMETGFALTDWIGAEPERCVIAGHCGPQSVLGEAL